MFINVACVLHVFDITPPIGQDGRPIKIEHVLSDTLVSCVLFGEWWRRVADASVAATPRMVGALSSQGLRQQRR